MVDLEVEAIMPHISHMLAVSDGNAAIEFTKRHLARNGFRDWVTGILSLDWRWMARSSSCRMNSPTAREHQVG
jgi:hypothetical protein